jgi:hypothetical protein
MKRGWIKLWRSILDKYKRKEFGFACYCLLKANHSKKEWKNPQTGRINIIHPGSFISSIRHMSDESGYSVREIRTLLDKMEATHFSTHKSTHLYTAVRVNNWAFYQGNGVEATHQTTQKATTTKEDIKKNKNDIYNKRKNFKEFLKQKEKLKRKLTAFTYKQQTDISEKVAAEMRRANAGKKTNL